MSRMKKPMIRTFVSRLCCSINPPIVAHKMTTCAPYLKLGFPPGRADERPVPEEASRNVVLSNCSFCPVSVNYTPLVLDNKQESTMWHCLNDRTKHHIVPPGCCYPSARTSPCSRTGK